MCGICGWVGPPDEQALQAFTDRMFHRGPDGRGTFSDNHISLGHRRLSIIDLENGVQPMTDATGRFVIVYNGELYNFPELRADLETLGHSFRTRCDTEVVVEAYYRWGEDCVRRFNGMFSMAVYDREERTLFLAVDRWGKKPLYWARAGNRLYFASELKAMRGLPGFSPSLSVGALGRYLCYDYYPAPHTVLEGVRKLPGGHRMVLGNDATDADPAPDCWYEPSFEPKLDISFEEARTEFARLLRLAVERRLLSDVPLGVFLSGGVDSNAAAAMMARLRPPSSVDTFSIAFTEKEFDESDLARRAAEHYGVNYFEERVDADRLQAVLPDAMAALDEPLADQSVMPTYLLSRFARQRVTVALGGDGGDELYAGYETFPANRMFHWFMKAPGPLRAALRHAVDLVPASSGYMGLDYKIRTFLRGEGQGLAQRNLRWVGPFVPEDVESLLTPEAREVIPWLVNGEPPLAEGVRILERTDARDMVDKVLHLYARTYLHDNNLARVDRISMAHSLEVRAPLLDADLTDFVNRVPAEYKMKGLTKKHLFRESVRGIVPDFIIDAPKHGFAVPLARWLRNGLSGLMRETLAEDRLRREGLFRPEAVARLIDDHMNRRRDNRKQLWALITFQMWRDNWERRI